LKKITSTLETIQPTSISRERIFSAAGGFSTKVRSSLQYKLLKALVFLKYYFLAGKEIK
jgi:hypothetical protein